MKIVSNSSPIIFLSKLRILDLVKKRYKKILLPTRVFQELTSDENYRENIEYIKIYENIFDLKKVNNIKKYDFNLHKGEKEALVLAIEKKADLIFLDDYAARTIAKIYKLKIRGTLGILIQFLKEGVIDYNKFESLLQALVSHKFRIDIELYNYALGCARKFKK